VAAPTAAIAIAADATGRSRIMLMVMSLMPVAARCFCPSLRAPYNGVKAAMVWGR
jgi:hypothetical protein